MVAIAVVVSLAPFFFYFLLTNDAHQICRFILFIFPFLELFFFVVVVVVLTC